MDNLTKKCKTCNEEKFLDQFELLSGKYYRNECYKCRARKIYHNNPEPFRNQALKRYGLTLQQFNTILISQNGKCAICGTDDPSCGGETKKSYNFHVDHDHETGIVRGLLCAKCNRGLGFFDDNPEKILASYNYLVQNKGDK